MNSWKKGEGIPLLDFEGGLGVPLLSFRGASGPTFKPWEGFRVPGFLSFKSQGPGPIFMPCRGLFFKF